ncbi:DUF2142 domain-containing protein [Methanobrevibacter sp.]|uniref:DUF2142 domain-containing protein n=1 Tax=Methanobrevibacter sp. TaxID=66852 RepID=UPI003890FC81
MFAIIVLLGIFCITYYFRHNDDKELYKVAFVIILCFGVITSVIVLICDVSDEIEHMNRAVITSEGVIFPHWTGEDYNLTRLYNYTHGNLRDGFNSQAGYTVPKAMYFFSNNLGKPVFETDGHDAKIDYTPVIVHSAFEQNPFYGYLPQAIGIAMAKLFDLNVIWMLWLGRIFNLFCYATLISFAIKKTPYLKIPLLAVACIPITIYQAASTSIDSMIFGLGILAVAYFIYMLKSPVENRDIVIFAVISLLLGLCKLPYLAFIFLLLFVPFENYRDKTNSKKLIVMCILTVAVIGILWSNYATPKLMHSWRSQYFEVNSTAQAQYFLSSSERLGNFLFDIATVKIIPLINGVFNFYGWGPNGEHYNDNYLLITTLLQLFLFFVWFLYPRKVKFDLKAKLGALFIILVVYIGTCWIQLLTWSGVGKINLGMSTRYFRF